jgi:hypothetical protein
MPIFTNPTRTPAQVAAQQILHIAKQQYLLLSRNGIQAYNLIWKNRIATPQEVVAALGTNAATVFGLADLYASTVQNAAKLDGSTPPSLPAVPSGYTVTINKDGTVTLVQPSTTEGGATIKK